MFHALCIFLLVAYACLAGFVLIANARNKRRQLAAINKVKSDVENINSQHLRTVRRMGMHAAVCHDLIIEVLQGEGPGDGYAESHALKYLREGVRSLATPDEKVAWLVREVPVALKRIADERIAIADNFKP